MTARFLVGACVLVPLLATPASAQPEPAQRRIIELEDCAAAALAAADFDADGWCDLAVLTGASRLLVFRNSQGALELFGDHPAGIAVLNGLLLLEPGDVDGDGTVDLVAGAVNGREIAVVYGRGDGSFEEPVLTVTRRRSRDFALADFDGDSALDIVAPGDVDVALVRFGADRLRPEESFIPTGAGVPHAVIPGDFDGDGAQDYIVWGRGGALTLAVRHGRGDGSFREEVFPAAQIPAEQFELGGVARDLDGDGRDEAILLRTDSDGDFLSDVWRLELADGSYDVAREATMPGAGRLLSPVILARDVDLDGDEDVLGLGGDTDEVFVLQSRGRDELAFESPCSVPIDIGAPPCDGGVANVTDLDAADFDRDGQLEVVAALPRSGIEILRGLVETCATLAAPCLEAGVVSMAPTGALVSLGDFTGDGNARLLTVEDGTASLLAADGEAFIVETTYAVPGVSRGLDSADLDRDGIDDFAVSDFTGDAVIVYLLAMGGDVRDTLVLEAGLLPAGLVIADLDSDGADDIAVTLSGADEVAVFPGRGDGRFDAAMRYAGGPGPARVGAGDLNGDGHVDLVTASVPSQSRISVLMGDPGGGFSSPLPAGVSIDSQAIELADLDGDGRDEATVVGRGTESVPGVTIVSAKEGEIVAHAVRSGEDARALLVSDLNGDGRLEIVLAHAISPVLNVMEWLGGSRVRRTVVPRSPRFPLDLRTSLAYGDIDRDGTRDIVVVGGSTGRIEVFRGCRKDALFRRGDVDGDAAVRLSDAVRLLQSLFAGGEELVCPDAADANDDGGLNLSDAVVILTHLFDGGPPPAAPGGEACGVDPSEDELRICRSACR